MRPTRLAAAAALALLAGTGCGSAGEAAPTGDAKRAERALAPVAEPGPGPRAPGSGPESFLGESGAPVPQPSGASFGRSPVREHDSQQAAEGDAPQERVDAYVAALARTGEPERMSEGLVHAAEGSAAHTYLVHEAAVAQARADGGEPAPNAEVGRVEDGYELCPGGERPCVAHTGFTARDGLVADLLVEGRDPGPGLSAPEGVETESAGVRATLLTSYESPADKSLTVTVEFTTAEDVSLDLPQASYEHGDDGGQVREAAGRYELDAGSATRAAFSFPGAAPGGTLRVDGCLAECSALVDIALPVE